jgi:hypothetical protein
MLIGNKRGQGFSFNDGGLGVGRIGGELVAEIAQVESPGQVIKK